MASWKKSWRRLKSKAKKTVRSVSKRAVKVHRVLDPLVTAGLGYMFPVVGAAAGTAASWFGTRMIGGMAARAYGMDGNEARTWARRQAVRTATYSAYAGAAGSAASLVVNLVNASAAASSANAAAAASRSAAAIPGVGAAGPSGVLGSTMIGPGGLPVPTSAFTGAQTPLSAATQFASGTGMAAMGNPAAGATLAGSMNVASVGGSNFLSSALGVAKTLAPLASTLYGIFGPKPEIPGGGMELPPMMPPGGGSSDSSSDSDSGAGSSGSPIPGGLLLMGGAALLAFALFSKRKAA